MSQPPPEHSKNLPHTDSLTLPCLSPSLFLSLARSLSLSLSFVKMIALQMGWNSSNNLEMQKSYMVQSPQKATMKVVIGFQAFFGLALFCLGWGLIQTFHVKNFSSDPDSLTEWDWVSKPDLTWIFIAVVGLVVFSYGFIGFWLCDRKRKLWRINLHLLCQLVLLLSTVGTIACLVIFEHERLHEKVVWMTFIPQGLLSLFQCMGVGQQLWEIMGVEDDKRSYRRYHRAATDPCVIGERSENRSLGEKLGILG